MPASPIRKLTPYADQAKRDGKKVYHLNIGQPDIETPEVMLNAIKNIDFKVWAYTPSEGIFSYRQGTLQGAHRLDSDRPHAFWQQTRQASATRRSLFRRY